MRIIKTGIAVATAVLAALYLVQCSDNGTDDDGDRSFEVREWGVLVGCQQDSSYFVTNRPEATQIVRVPVIYVHSQKLEPFTVKVTFNNGGPLETYPQGEVTQHVVEWQNVRFAAGEWGATKPAPDDHIPFGQIRPILNNVDADELIYAGVRSRFLYYEGNVSFRNNVVVSYDLDSLVAHLRNSGSYPLYDVNVVITAFDTGSTWSRVYYAATTRLDPGQTVDVLLYESPRTDYKANLIAQGFSESEAEAFSTLWTFNFNTREPIGYAKLIYRLPQSEYDKLIDLKITPTPDKTIRTLYVLVHVNDPRADSLIIRGLIGDWEWVKSVGGIGGNTITPESVGYTKTIHFPNDSVYVEDRNDTTILETKYSCVQKNRSDR